MSIAVALGLAAGLCVGGADFLGGLAARRHSALAVALWSQAAAGLALLTLLPLLGRAPDTAALSWGLGAGVCSGVGQLCFFRALALGPMGYVAPIAGGGAALPVALGLVAGDRPDPLALGGTIAAFAGVGLLSLRPGEARGARPALVPALGAAAGLGLFYLLIARGATGGGSPVWIVAGDGLGSLAVLLPLAACARTTPWPGRRVGLLGAVGLLDLIGNAAYALAFPRGVATTLATRGNK